MMITGITSLTEITLPDGIEYIGANPFVGNAMASIELVDSNENYCVEDGMLLTKDGTTLISAVCGGMETFTVPNGVETISRPVFRR